MRVVPEIHGAGERPAEEDAIGVRGIERQPARDDTDVPHRLQRLRPHQGSGRGSLLVPEGHRHVQLIDRVPHDDDVPGRVERDIADVIGIAPVGEDTPAELSIRLKLGDELPTAVKFSDCTPAPKSMEPSTVPAIATFPALSTATPLTLGLVTAEKLWPQSSFPVGSSLIR